MFWLTVLGCVIFVEGIPYFLSPRMVKQVALKVIEMRESSMRSMGFCLLAAGLGLVFLATHGRG
ncbi:MAG: DUF2065 domain-containing protein [Desulfuromonadales bacterium]|nr:DUF2065 domain-containing protein [Desulfuromonadales bacterium]NIR34034.1 DUF2065 domain-containing protein [Desulfuromonadales bacterium]NIS44085.1 DUF2065 domain-containing protein [Desulfuromonadales bacterium]